MKINYEGTFSIRKGTYMSTTKLNALNWKNGLKPTLFRKKKWPLGHLLLKYEMSEDGMNFKNVLLQFYLDPLKDGQDNKNEFD